MRTRMIGRRPWVAAALLAVLTMPALADLVAGQPLPALRLKDQHDQDWYVRADTQLVIFAAGRKASSLVQGVLDGRPKGFLAAHHAVYLADMSKMPGIITRTFALPSLREQNYGVGVSLDEKTLAGWPRQDDAVTLIRLAQGRYASHVYATSELQIRAALGL